jgi:hypothetical protein
MTTFDRPLYYSDEAETIPVDEAEDIERAIEALEQILRRTKLSTGTFRADVHVKTHGFAEGEFQVLPNLPNVLTQGLFEHAGGYPAVVRFSNSASQAQPDAIPDGRGMAIKVRDVNGEASTASGVGLIPFRPPGDANNNLTRAVQQLRAHSQSVV